MRGDWDLDNLDLEEDPFRNVDFLRDMSQYEIDLMTDIPTSPITLVDRIREISNRLRGVEREVTWKDIVNKYSNNNNAINSAWEYLYGDPKVNSDVNIDEKGYSVKNSRVDLRTAFLDLVDKPKLGLFDTEYYGGTGPSWRTDLNNKRFYLLDPLTYLPHEFCHGIFQEELIKAYMSHTLEKNNNDLFKKIKL